MHAMNATLPTTTQAAAERPRQRKASLLFFGIDSPENANDPVPHQGPPDVEGTDPRADGGDEAEARGALRGSCAGHQDEHNARTDRPEADPAGHVR